MPRPPQLLRAALIAASALSTGACGTYLHDSGLQADTAAIKSDFVALKAPAFIAEQRQRMEAFGAREDEAVAAFVVGRRDQAVLDIVRPNPAAAATDSVQRLRRFVDGDLMLIFPRAEGVTQYSDAELNLMGTAHARLLRLNQAVASTERRTANALSRFRLNAPPGDKRPTACGEALKIPRVEPATDADRDYDVFLLECANLRTLQTGTIPSVRELNTFLDGFASGQVRDIRSSIAASRDESIRAQAEAAATKKLIADLLAREQAGASPTAEFDAQLAKLDELLKTAGPLAQLAGLDELVAPLEAALKQALDPAASGVDSATSRRAAAALGLLRASVRADAAFSAKPDVEKGRALLIGIAELRHRQNVAKLDVAHQAARRRFLDAQLEALLLRAGRLAYAEQMLRQAGLAAPRGFGDLRAASPGSRARLSEALTAYQAAWDAGEVPYQVLQFRLVQLDRLHAIDRAAVTEADYRAVLGPSIDQLAAYGEGGVKPESIVTLLGDLGIAGAILGN